MWIAGLTALEKPMVQLHTQYNREIPWSTIDMDFMNLNQTAHGGREFGFIGSRLRMDRKIIVGHWSDAAPRARLAAWMRAAAAVADSRSMSIARFGDNMREVAVTEGDKVEAQIKFGYAVHGYGVGDLVERIDAVTESEATALLETYDESYQMTPDLRSGGDRRRELATAARIEAGLRAFLGEGNFGGFTTTFENLHGIAQLPGLACQRLMADGYGFGGEGDWKTAALVRAMKVMADGLEGGTTFMEDYTYHFANPRDLVLGAHMLEVCPSIAGDGPVKLEMHPLGIGGKDDPARLVFDGESGEALNATIVDMGDRFRMIVNEVRAVPFENDMPALPVARVIWDPKPNLEVAAEAWIRAGGAHHTGYSRGVTTEMLEDFAGMTAIELLVIDDDTKPRKFRQEILWNDASWRLKNR
jgi:L-arabinose isomerase